MMQTGGKNLVTSRNGLATSLAWGLNGEVEYVLEGNLNYTGAVITWLKKGCGTVGIGCRERDAGPCCQPCR